ncbi:MAG: hypothetical protein J7J07_06850 [Syntrophobacterales bacterium]|nr:hypothetical protein [Syntrophobacterales bacterium]
MNERIEKLYVVYFLVLGLVTLGFGMADFIVTASGSEYTSAALIIPNDGFRGGWGGLVMIFAGIFYLSGLKNAREIHQLGKIVMGSMLIWIMAGTDIFGMIAGSIPGGEEGWFNTAKGFLGTYAPPYAPAILLLPFSLVVIFYVHRHYRESKTLKKA